MTLSFVLMKVKHLTSVSVQKEMPAIHDPDPALEAVILPIKVVVLPVMPPPSDSTELPHRDTFYEFNSEDHLLLHSTTDGFHQLSFIPLFFARITFFFFFRRCVLFASDVYGGFCFFRFLSSFMEATDSIVPNLMFE